MCIVVDDFGLHAGINHAVLALAALGRVHAVSALVGAPAFAAGTPLLRGLDAQGLDIGLHLDLTESPLLGRSWPPLAGLIAQAYARRLDPRCLHAEIAAQCDAFEAALGHGPAFVDGHRHVHQLPVVRQMLVAQLRERYGTHLPWWRCTRRGGRGLKPWLINALGGNAACSLAGRHGFGCNRRLLGVYDFSGGSARYLQRLDRWLSGAGDGDLLMCHPARGAVGTEPLAGAREAEFDVLAAPAFLGLLQSHGICLQPMSRILARLAG